MLQEKFPIDYWQWTFLILWKIMYGSGEFDDAEE